MATTQTGQFRPEIAHPPRKDGSCPSERDGNATERVGGQVTCSPGMRSALGSLLRKVSAREPIMGRAF
jgi:hypothetical protein